MLEAAEDINYFVCVPKNRREIAGFAILQHVGHRLHNL
jgi:hypothetical protein